VSLDALRHTQLANVTCSRRALQCAIASIIYHIPVRKERRRACFHLSIICKRMTLYFLRCHICPTLLTEINFEQAYSINISLKLAYQLPPVHLPVLKLFKGAFPSPPIIRIRKASIDIHWFCQIFIPGTTFMQCR
jgi:hypothetical protein